MHLNLSSVIYCAMCHVVLSRFSFAWLCVTLWTVVRLAPCNLLGRCKILNFVRCSVQSVQSFNHVWLFAIPWTTEHQASLSITNSQGLLKLMPIVSVMPSNHLILCCPLLLLPSVFPSIRAFSNESVLCIIWPKYWIFIFSIRPPNEYSGLISFRMDWLDLFAVQGTLKSLLQHHSSKASILQCSAFIIVQLPHPYLSIGKTIAFTRWTFVSKVMSLVLIYCLGWS